MAGEDKAKRGDLLCLGPLVGPPAVSNRLLGLVRRILQTVRFIKQVGSTNEPHDITEDFQFVKTHIVIQNTGLKVKLPTYGVCLSNF